MSRISVEEAARLWHEAGDDELRDLARAARARWHEPDRATYMVMRIVNYTNVCVAQCDYCAFYVLPNEDGGYVLDRSEVFAKIDELLEVGGDLVAFNGGFNPKLPLEFYCDLFAAVRQRYGGTASGRRRGTASRGRATPSSRSARSWTRSTPTR